MNPPVLLRSIKPYHRETVAEVLRKLGGACGYTRGRVSSGNVIESLRTVAKRYFENVHSSHDWSHVQRVLQMCMVIGEKEGTNLRILKLAELLHDIARHEEDLSKGQICHGQRGAELAEETLRQHGI